MKRKISFLFFLLIATVSTISAQNTVGVLTLDGTEAFPGYNFIYPAGQPNVYLLDNCGRVVHWWEDSTGYVPGNSAYLMENGDIIKTKRNASVAGDPIWAGGGGAFVERRDWDNNLLWKFELNNAQSRLHHDILPMDNGNILMIAWDLKDSMDCINAGRNPALLSDGEVWSDMIIEVKPIGTDSFSIVWQWDSWDHLIQDFDSAASNYGQIIQHPELIDLNYDGTGTGEADWLHCNALDYNEELDQIAISSPEFSEIWIIDHSTTTAQAAGHTGGLGNRGGDLLFRWGNPMTYGQGDSTDQQLFYQHDIHWMNDELPASDPDFGKLMCFSNRHPGDYSTVQIIDPAWVNYDWAYEMSGGAFLPGAPDWTYIPTPQNAIYSNILSSGQKLANGNVLIGVGRPGYAREVNPAGDVVWEFKNPLVGGTPVSQGDTVNLSTNMMFRVKRYSMGYGAFAGRTLTPGDQLEMNGDTSLCAQLALSAPAPSEELLAVYPNPVQNILHLSRSTAKPAVAELVSMVGQVVSRNKIQGFSPEIDVTGIPHGVYVLRLDGRGAVKVIVE